jgi:ubiquinone/menaquinone biosynthesis C-methylase UbiE
MQKEAQQKYWSRVSSQYDSLYSNEWSLFEDMQVRRWIEEIGVGGGRLLDLGCGTGLGYFLSACQAKGFEYEGIDISQDMLDQMSRKYPQAMTRNLSLEELDCLPSSGYRNILALNSVLSYSGDFYELIRQIFRLLEPGGVFLVSALNRYSLRRITRLKILSEETFQTRNADKGLGGVPARTISRGAFAKMAIDEGFEDVLVKSQGVLAGVCERPKLLPLEKQLQSLVPCLGHCIYLSGRRPW